MSIAIDFRDPIEPITAALTKFAGYSHAPANWIRRRLAIHRYRRTFDRMSNPVLRDMGIRREDIAGLVAEHIDGEGHPFGGFPFL